MTKILERKSVTENQQEQNELAIECFCNYNIRFVIIFSNNWLLDTTDTLGAIFCIDFSDHINHTNEYVMHCMICYQALFGICMIVQMHMNACSCFSIHLYELAWHSNGSQMSNVRVPFKWVNTWQSSKNRMLLPDFKVSWELQCSVILICSAAQCFH